MTLCKRNECYLVQNDKCADYDLIQHRGLVLGDNDASFFVTLAVIKIKFIFQTSRHGFILRNWWVTINISRGWVRAKAF